MQILLIDECYPLNTRNVKILTSLHVAYPDAALHVITWDREGGYQTSDEPFEYHLYTLPATYGNKVQKLKGLFGYRKYCHKVIKEINPDVVIASHWNNLLMLPSLDHKRQKLIYENLDAPTGPALGRKLLNIIERRYMRRAALTIHASRFYTSIYPTRYRQIVLENKPVIETQPVCYSPATPLRIAYLGNIRYLDILKNLVDSVRGDQRFGLYFHGGGPDLQRLKDYIGEEHNIHCTGPYRYEDIEQHYKQTDIIWAAYPNKDFNVRYAISNKFHESIAYAIPSIYADKTMLGEYAEQQGIGYQVDPYSVEAIKALLDKIVAEPTQLIATHQHLLTQSTKETTWQEDFKQLTQVLDKAKTLHFV